MKSIYVGCSLTDAPREFTDKVETLKKCLREMGYEVFDFLGTTVGIPKDVYQWDIHHCVAKCDLFLAICDYSSIGLGYELGVAVEKHGKKVLAVAEEERRVTRLIQGVNHSNFIFARYENFDQILDMVREMMPLPEEARLPKAA